MIIILEGGIIQDISDIPKGMEVEVRDYDHFGSENYPDHALEVDENGDRYISNIFVGDNHDNQV